MKSDLELMSDFRHGDRRAFHKLIRRHHVAILNFFYPLAGTAAAADELSQKVFLRMFNELEQQAEFSLWGRQLYEPMTFQTYLFRSGYICWLEHLRRGSLTQALPFSQPITSNNAESPAMPGFKPLEAENKQCTFVLLAPLPNELKPVVVLQIVNGLSYNEIAAVLNVSTGTIKNRMREAFRLLRAGRVKPGPAMSATSESDVGSSVQPAPEAGTPGSNAP